jgi:hypothetical protein
MSLLVVPFRLAGAGIAWAMSSALVIVIEASVTRGHAPAALVIGVSFLALGLGAIAGTIVWRTSRSHPVHAVGVLAVLVVAFVTAAVVGGASLRG